MLKIAAIGIALVLPISALAQSAGEPAIPPDRLELSTTDAQAVSDVTQRTAIIQLLRGALQHSNVRAQPYDLATTFNAVGGTPYDGSWRLRDTSPGTSIYRWTAEGPSYSVVNLFQKGLLYSNQPVSVPLRLAQVRELIFFKTLQLGPRAHIRTFEANLDGTPVTCALISYAFQQKQETGSRHWDEVESCVDPASLNLITYSPVPGAYTRFDYSQALHFQDKIIFNGFVSTQGGQPVIEARIESLQPAPNDPALYQPNGLNAIGMGSIMTQPWTVRMNSPAKTQPSNANGDMVVLHAMRLPNGQMTSAEVIASTNSSLNSAALAQLGNWGGREPETEPGATPLSSEVLVTVHFVVLPRAYAMK